jgi:molybdopterin synthase catalytic subunit
VLGSPQGHFPRPVRRIVGLTKMTSPVTLEPPASGHDWFALVESPLPVHVATDWVVRPDCGGVVTFVGTARDHSEGRPDVELLEYEAYETQVVPRLAQVAAEARARWSTVGNIALLHRIGPLQVTEAAVVVAVSAPHRDEAFAAARFCIDALKQSVPIWKKERWDGGESWGLEAQHLEDPAMVGGQEADR